MKRRLFRAGALLVCVCLGAFILWSLAPLWVQDPLCQLSKQTPVRTWLDREGKVLWQERTYDYQWRFEVPLSQISPHVVRVMLASEDGRFYEHSGVDYGAVLRAAWQNLSSGRIVSGASTLSMQLAGLSLPPGQRGLARKLKQATLARKLERCHSKQEILSEYLNRVPFGGKIYGIEAAARYYFGLHASELNLAEATLLCGLPQKPNRFRPDRHFETARERQRIILKLLVSHGQMTPEEAERVLKEEPLRLRDFGVPSDFEQHATPGELTHVFEHSAIQPGVPGPIQLSLDWELQNHIRSLLKGQCQRLSGVRDGAAFLIKNQTGEVLCYLGTLDFNHPQGGQVNVVRASRSAGSALKPFIYLQAIEAGWIVAGTKLDDHPLRYGTYAPANYEGKFLGSVSASYALSHSLNTPVIQLLARLGIERVFDSFDKFGLVTPRSGEPEEVGLSLALGTLGHSLWNMVQAYSVLANEGRWVQPTFLCNQEPSILKDHLYLPGSCLMISKMLRESSLARSPYPLAWKTGTSNNNCDAWCFAYTPDYTLGVWLGNKEGTPSPDLVGIRAAGPVVAEVFHLLYQDQPLPQWPSDQETFEMKELCAVSGLLPGSYCKHFETHCTLPGLPLASCKTCTPSQKVMLKILSPAPKDYVSPFGESVRLPLLADQPDVYWFLNGRSLGQNLKEYDFEVGQRYHLRAVCEQDWASAEVYFSVSEE